jgi:hypothetical protein
MEKIFIFGKTVTKIAFKMKSRAENIRENLLSSNLDSSRLLNKNVKTEIQQIKTLYLLCYVGVKLGLPH